MSKRTTAQRRTSPHWRRRLIAALLVLVGIMAIHRVINGPALRPVTRRLLPPGYMINFSVENYGYPALQSASNAGLTPYRYSSEICGVPLDDRCVPIPGKRILFWSTSVSPQRKMIYWQDYFDAGKPHVLLRAGNTARECPIDQHGWPPWSVTDDGVLYCLPARDDNLPRPPITPPRTPDGSLLPPGDHYRWIELPKCATGYQWAPVPCADARFLAMKRVRVEYIIQKGRVVRLPATQKPDNTLFIYDIGARRFILQAPYVPQPSAPLPTRSSNNWNEAPLIVFHASGRFLAVPVQGQAHLYIPGQPMRVYGKEATLWQFGEDGTVWAPGEKSYSVLHWQHGSRKVNTLALKAAPDPRFMLVESPFHTKRIDWMPGPCYSLRTQAAAWNDGELTVQTETVKLMPEGMARVYDLGRHLLGQQKLAPREGRRLTLYRHGKRLGTFTVRLKYAGSRSMPYREHLAFTHDGRYLSWVIDAGNGLQVYAFKVPKSAWQVW